MVVHCRLCAEQKDPAELIASVSDLKVRLIRCCRWQESDDEDQLPQRACDMCLVSLGVCWRFMDQVEAADSKLKSLFLNGSAIPTKQIDAVYFNNDDAIEDVKEIEMQSADNDIHFNRSTRLRQNQLASVEVSGQPITFMKFPLDENPLLDNDLVDDMEFPLCKVEINESPIKQFDLVEQSIALESFEGTLEQPSIGQGPNESSLCDSHHLKQEDDIDNDDYSPDGPSNHGRTDDLSSDSEYPPSKSTKVRRAMTVSSSQKATPIKRSIHCEYDIIFEPMVMQLDVSRTEQSVKKKVTRIRKKPGRFLSGVSHQMCLPDGSISEEGVSKLEQSFPEMKTVSWETCKYKCEKCPQTIEGPNKFFIHFQSTHFSELDSYRFLCYYCDDVQDSLFKLNRHIASEHYIHLRYRCSMCPKMYFWNLTHLEKHQSSHSKPKFKCDLCNKSGLNNVGLITHIRNMHLMKTFPEKFEKFICDICKAEFRIKHAIRSHMITHSKARNFVCEHCGHAFGSKGILTGHIEAKHVVPKHFYTCTIENCGKAFKSTTRLKAHIPTHGPKRFKCDGCDLIVASRKSLRDHKLIHENKREHACNFCEKKFRLKTTLRTHERIHLGIKPYVCPKCEYRSANWGNLEKHTQRIHSISMKREQSLRIDLQQ